MAKQKRGLHKEITSIFDGVPVPETNGEQTGSGAPSPGRAGYSEQRGDTGRRLNAPVAPKAPVKSAKEPQIPKPRESVRPAVEEIPTEQAGFQGVVVIGGESFWQKKYQQIKNKLFAVQPGVNVGRQQVMVVLVPVLCVVMIFVFFRVFSGPKGKVVLPVQPNSSNSIVACAAEVNWQLPDPYPSALRDPMQFGRYEADPTGGDGPATTNELTISGIVYSEDKPAALIGTRIVYVDDMVGDAKVVRIDRESVEFERDGKTWTQKVQQ